ncbi:MAG: hypothetical protein ACHQHN_09215 [Sphingobacteriales bacterium]
MFTSKRTLISGIILLMLCTCNYPGTQSQKDNPAPVDAVNKVPMKDFLDSVLMKTYLSFDQVKDYTNIDSTYYKEHVKFTGDTVWYRKGKHPLAIIRFRVGRINKKLLLVFNQRGKCTASLIVGMDGDVDSFDSVVLNYKISDNNSFSTTETWTYCPESSNDKITITKQFYQINKKGNILAQNNIIRSFTRPKDPATSH